MDDTNIGQKMEYEENTLSNYNVDPSKDFTTEKRKQQLTGVLDTNVFEI